MKKVHYTIMACFFFGMAQAQVGIGTVTPNATLDIKAANQAAPANNDGILIPKIDEFSLTPPTVAQDGMLVYATGTGAPSKGFYYWDNATSSWLLLNNGSTTDADWFEEGTTNFPNTITDNIYTNGNVAIGKTMAQYALDIADTLNGRGVNVSLTGTSVVDSYGGYFKVNRPVDGQAYGLYIDVSGAVKMNTVQNGLYTRLVQSGGSTNVGVQNSLLGTGTGNQLGIYNTLWGNSDGDQYGVSNVITNSGSGQHIGIENSLYGAGTGGKYGVNTYIEPTAGGIHYGIFSNVLKTGSYAGYFLGNVAIGTDAANIYNLPASRGTVNQVMQTDGSGNVSWASPSSIGSWSLSGNTGTNPATQFLGTMDSVSVAIRIKNIEKWRFTTLGQLEFLNNNDNILIGLNAGNTAEASSGGHTFVGNGAGQNVGTFSSWNTYIGLEAGENTTSGSVNTYVGTFAGKATTTGGANTYIGKEAGASTTTGGGNIAIGQKSGTVNSTGDFNVYIGQLLGDSSDGNNNVLVGNRTHIGNATGSNNNVIIGFKGGEGQTDGANNIMIGGNELRFPNLAGSNQLNIGNLIYGVNVDGTVNTLSTGNIGIGVQTPVDKLEVAGKIRLSTNTTNAAQLRNDDNFNHLSDNNIDFGDDVDSWMLSSRQGTNETSGIWGGRDFVTVWAPGDNNRIIRFLDEDSWIDNDGDPYNNTAERGYIDSAGQYFQASDKNRKENIQPIENAMKKISKVNGFTYNFKLNSTEKAKSEVALKTSGVLAQELIKIFPEAVRISENDEYFVHYAGIVPLLIEGIKEQQTEIETLKRKITELKNLEERIKKLEMR